VRAGRRRRLGMKDLEQGDQGLLRVIDLQERAGQVGHVPGHEERPGAAGFRLLEVLPVG